MKTDEALKLIGNQDFLNQIYRFSYHRCNTSLEAEDLCSEIILAVLSAVRRQEQVEHFHAFVWKIAHRVYADYCEKRNRAASAVSLENSELPLVSQENGIDDFIEETEAVWQLRKIFSEIAFLSKAYREVMILYYIDELKVKEIASRLDISETTVKQRLFSARNIIRKEVETMNERNLTLKPVSLSFIGTGNPTGNDPRTKAERSFSQHLIYLCRDKPKSARELSEELCVPMPYIEEELEIQCRGQNGKYGMLRRLDNGKYTINILIADYDEYNQANQIYSRHLSDFCGVLKAGLERNREKLLSFPYLSPQSDPRFILWSFISQIESAFDNRVNQVIAGKYFSDIAPADREYSCAAIAYTDHQKSDFYGCDGISAKCVGGYRSVFVRNIYGKRIEAHFHCGHNLSNDAELLMVLRAIGGLSVGSLTETEKEIAAKAVECGYLRKTGDILEPKIIVIGTENAKAYYRFSFDLTQGMEGVIEETAKELAAFMKQHIPGHLIHDYQLYTELIAGHDITSQIIDECIREGLLTEPENGLGAEGVLMVVEREGGRKD